MARFNSCADISRVLRKELQALFPDAAVKVQTVKEHRDNGYRPIVIDWYSGPSREEVQTVVENHTHMGKVLLRRQNNPAEQEVAVAAMMAAHEAERAAYEASAPQRAADAERTKVANRAAGKAKAAETRDAKAGLTAKLAAAFPDVEFTLKAEKYGRFHCSYRGGPAAKDVAAVDEKLLGGYLGVLRLRVPADDVAEALANAKIVRRYDAVARKLAALGVVRECRVGRVIDAAMIEEMTALLEPARKLLRLRRSLAAVATRVRAARPMPRRIPAQMMLPFGGDMPVFLQVVSGRMGYDEIAQFTRNSLTRFT